MMTNARTRVTTRTRLELRPVQHATKPCTTDGARAVYTHERGNSNGKTQDTL